jgi:hypothetical protein
MMVKTWAVLVWLALLGACTTESPTESPPENAAQAAEDVAMVERMSREPFQSIVPEPITAADVARYGLDRPGCGFRKTGAQDILFFGDASDGFLKIGDDLKRFSAKTSSAELPSGARTTYIGLASWLNITHLPDAEGDGDPATAPARLVLHDAQERVAFMADGTITCTS